MDATPIVGLDAAFLSTETESTHWHVVGVLWIDDRTAPAPFTAGRVRDLVAHRADRLGLLRRRVDPRWLGLPAPHWVGAEIDLEHHVRSEVAPPGSGPEFVDAVASRTAGRPLDRDRPLWEITVVTGVDGPGGATAAFVAKVHHSLVDGVAALGVLASLVDLDAQVPPRRASEVVPAPDGAGSGRAREVVDAPARAARALGGLARAAWRAAGSLRDPETRPGLPRAPRVGISGSLTARRTLVGVDVALGDVEQIRAVHGVTFNDLGAAIVTGALRRWLGAAGALPEAPLVAAVPVSVRGHRGGEGNAVSLLVTELPTHLTDGTARVRTVASSLDSAKATHAAIGPDALGDLAAVAPWPVLAGLFRVFSDLGLADRLPPAVNLSLTSVAGPPLALFLAGSRVTACAAFGPILDSVGLNVTVISYADRVGFGITGCPDLGPDVATLADHVHAEVASLLVEALASRPLRSVSDAQSDDGSGADPVAPTSGRSDATAAVVARNREVLAAVQVRRDRLADALATLVATAADDVDPSEWRTALITAAAGLRAVFAAHVHSTESARGTEGFFAAVVDHAPQLAHQARTLQDEHPPLAERIEALVGRVSTLDDSPAADAVADVRREVGEVVAAVDRHRHRGAQLVLDAYNVDLATGD